MQPCAYADAASLAAALTDAGCDVTGTDCSARCAEAMLPLERECRSLMGPYQALGRTCINTERGQSADRFDDPNTETGRECHDGIDNDNDGSADCDDPDCASNMRACGRPGGSQASCDTTALYGTLMECSTWSATALADGVIDESDGFCTSSCYTQLSPIQASCASRMTRAMSTAFEPLVPMLGECASSLAARGSTGCMMQRVQGACGDPTAAATTCTARCTRILDTESHACAADPGFAAYAPVIAACAQSVEEQRCDATATNFLTNVDSSCCRDEDCTDLPKACTEECANTYMPFFSRCGRHTFGADETNLQKFEAFERLCAATLGRTVDTTQPGAQLRGPDRRDPCSQTADCGSCSGDCGWCKDEVTNPRTLLRSGGGWCSGACTTTDGECAAVDPTAGGGH
jgi:hypothetical protein|eukprot:COSAG02_NODE_597_length_19775_cov_28.914312_15_plen_404_part_00